MRVYQFRHIRADGQCSRGPRRPMANACTVRSCPASPSSLPSILGSLALLAAAAPAVAGRRRRSAQARRGRRHAAAAAARRSRSRTTATSPRADDAPPRSTSRAPASRLVPAHARRGPARRSRRGITRRDPGRARPLALRRRRSNGVAVVLPALAARAPAPRCPARPSGRASPTTRSVPRPRRRGDS